MAKYRQIQTHFWTDAWVMDLTPEKKYFYLYILTNDKVKQCGIYEIPLRKMEVETGYNRDTLLLLLDEFVKMNKIRYNLETKEICIINFSKYNFTQSPKVKACIRKEFNQVKDKKLIGYIYGMHSLYKDYDKSINTDAQEKQKEEEKEEKKQKEKILEVYSKEIEDILSFWGFTGKDDKRELLLKQLQQLSKNQIPLVVFFKQANNYITYKQSVSERKHAFNRFLGLDNPNDINTAGWNTENWEHKLKSLKRINITNQTKNYESGL
ncbi:MULTISPECIES: hypothetical protein [unclassified Carboxylicivirga]|uniref:hypothetical protein n=1 Tax=Carboxylicivirga TaxID=1628153 RepID=UPI003D34F378